MSVKREIDTAPDALVKLLAFGIVAAAFVFLGLVGWALVRVVDFYTTAH